MNEKKPLKSHMAPAMFADDRVKLFVSRVSNPHADWSEIRPGDPVLAVDGSTWYVAEVEDFNDSDEEEYNRGACLRVLDRLPDDEVDVWNVLYFRDGMKLELAESDWLTYRQALDAKHRVEREIGSENACAELVRVSR